MIEKKPILNVAMLTPVKQLFSYWPPNDVLPENLQMGLRVKVPFRSREIVGIIESISHTAIENIELKTAIAILDASPLLPPDVYELCQWMSRYYHHSLGNILNHALPTFIKKGRPLVETKAEVANLSITPPPMLHAEQMIAVQHIIQYLNLFRVFLLYGITGSGKTEVYLRVIESALAEEKQILILVPEINLTPQTLSRFQARFNIPIAAYHSNLTDKKRLQVWSNARAGKVKIIIGTRSAVFMPFKNLGLIIIDEEHDGSFKQMDSFRYHARDAAIKRAQINNIPIILGTATPSLETLLNAQQKRYQLLTLSERAGGALLPTIDVIDTRLYGQDSGISTPLLTAITDHLGRQKHVMIFLNRRGFSPILYCTDCHWIAVCARCNAKLVYHHYPIHLQCHHCDKSYALPQTCHSCKNATLQAVGLGTQRLEAFLTTQFPNVPIFRVDRDNTRKKNSIEDLLHAIEKADQGAILLGTQMLAKGHHFPKVTLVGLLNTDSGFFSADYRGTEQIGQLILQVSGRAGREQDKGCVMIQTRQPDHPLLQILLQQNYLHFAETLLQERKLLALPPYGYIAYVRAEGEETRVLACLQNIKSKVSDLPILGPVIASGYRAKHQKAYQLIMKAKTRRVLHAQLLTVLMHIDKVPRKASVKWIIDIDPIEF